MKYFYLNFQSSFRDVEQTVKNLKIEATGKLFFNYCLFFKVNKIKKSQVQETIKVIDHDSHFR